MFVSTSRLSLIALAIAQAFALSSSAMAQSNDNVLPAVTVTAVPDTTGRAATASVGGFSEQPLQETPASITVITQQQMQDRNIRSTTGAVETDASVNDSYNAVGYAEQFSIRGFKLENATSFRKDGLSFSGASSVPLENKEQIEVLKGISGLQAGVSTPGGIINYVTKRPTDKPLRTVTTSISERGTVYGAVDLGGKTDDKRFGYRINAASESIRSYVNGADGNRNFVSGAFDWQLTDRALLQLDMDYQHKSQITAPGYQLLDGTTLPTHVDPKRLLGGGAPWIAPVVDDTSNIGLRFKYTLNQDWHMTLAANRYELKRDDRSAFPYGCSASGLFPGYCANGDYDIYDYKSDNEVHTILGTQALLQGKFATGTVKHDITFGATYDQRRDKAGQPVYGTVPGGSANGSGNINSDGYTDVNDPSVFSGPVYLKRKDDEWSVFTQDVMALSDKLKLHAGLRYTDLSRDQFDVANGAQVSDYNRSYFLPNIALVFSPQQNLSVYGAYSQGLQHGGIPPNTTGELMLNPSRSHQFEVGLKTDVTNNLSFTAALFQIKSALEYYDASNTFVQNGDAVHRGLELGVQGKPTQNLLVGASLTALDAKQEGTGDASLDGKRNVNVPKLKSVTWLEYTLPQMPEVKLNTQWVYSSSKAFDTKNTTIVPSYNVFNVGARYETKINGVKTNLNFTVDNVFNKSYWRDVTQDLGGYLFPGAPRTFMLTAQFGF